MVGVGVSRPDWDTGDPLDCAGALGAGWAYRYRLDNRDRRWVVASITAPTLWEIGDRWLSCYGRWRELARTDRNGAR